MASRTLEELLEARRAIKGALREARAQLGQAQRRAATNAREWVLVERLRRASVAMYHLAGDAEPAVAYLRACGRERHWMDLPAPELVTQVEDLYLGAGIDEIVSLVDETAPTDPVALVLAHKYVGEWRAACWARRVNEEKGVPVSNASLLQRYEQSRSQAPEALRPHAVGVTGERRAKRFLAKFRKRWVGRYGAIPSAERVSAAEVRSKAAHQNTRRLVSADSRFSLFETRR